MKRVELLGGPWDGKTILISDFWSVFAISGDNSAYYWPDHTLCVAFWSKTKYVNDAEAF